MASASEDAARESARQKVQEEIDLVWTKSQECPICGNSDWSILNLVDIPLRTIETAAWTMGDLTSGREAYVFVPVTCVNCGYTRFFHTGALGVAAGNIRDKQARDEG